MNRWDKKSCAAGIRSIVDRFLRLIRIPFYALLFVFLVACSSLNDTPGESAGGLTGSEIAPALRDLSLENRESRIFSEMVNGNIPSWLFELKEVTYVRQLAGETYEVTFSCTPDYLSVGTDNDYFLTPLTPGTAQNLADHFGYSLPTPDLVDEIWKAAIIRLVPSPIPPSPQMTTIPVFEEHNRTVQSQMEPYLSLRGSIVAGHKKDVVITPRLESAPGKVAIYGWHKLNGDPIQPLYTGHVDYYADYSHGIRLVNREIRINSVKMDLVEVLQDPDLAGLVSSDGVIAKPAYPGAENENRE